jgi:hypothetical protein
MEARRRVELVTLVEKAAMDLARAVTALVEKAIHTLEAAAADGRRIGDGGRQAVALERDGDAGWRALGWRTPRRRGGVRS